MVLGRVCCEILAGRREGEQPKQSLQLLDPHPPPSERAAAF